MAKDTRSNAEFADYLDRVGDDYAESGYEATSEDYHEAAKRIRDLDAYRVRCEIEDAS